MRRIAFALNIVILVLAAVPASASPQPTVLHSFNVSDGVAPQGALIQGADGNLYGTSPFGVSNNNGNIFTIDTFGNNFNSIFPFTGTGGSNPIAGVIQASDGFLYGTTQNGGANSKGAIFKVAIDGTGYTDLYDFGSSASDGQQPQGGVIQGSDGAFYGTTLLGGANSEGTVFRFVLGVGLTILHSFGPSDLEQPAASLVQGPDGSLYGTASLGGTSSDGGVFRINLDGTGYAVLHNFAGNRTDGQGSVSPLIVGGDGFLYGTTAAGGIFYSNGTIFQIAPDGTSYQVLRSFTGGLGDSIGVNAPLTLGNDGKLYGCSVQGGINGSGVIFQDSRDGTGYNVLFNGFGGLSGSNPYGGMVQATNGIFYGTTYGGGANSFGTIFSFNTGLSASPNGLYAIGSDAQVQLFWNTDTLADPSAGYNLYRSTTSGGEGNTPYQTNLLSPQFIDNNVSNGTQYFYQVTAINPDASESAKSYEVTATPQMALDPAGLSAAPNPVEATKSTTGTVTLIQATTGPTTAFLSSDNPNVTFTNPDVTVPTGQGTSTFTINTANTGSAYSATITASENQTEASTTINVTVPPTLHTFQPGLQMIAGPTDDSSQTLSSAFGDSTAMLAVWTGSFYVTSLTPPADTIVPGQGYWFHPASTATLYDIGDDESSGNTVNVSLVQGWNMIGDPFTDPLSGADLGVQSGPNVISFSAANIAGLIGSTLYTWQPADSAYETQPVSTATLQPYEGYWIYAFKPSTLVLKDLP